jgi:two-component system response regulator YesN
MKVLIIDDEPMFRFYLAHALSASGWEVFDHDEHADFPALIREHGIDILVSDYRMAQITGLDLIENLRNARIEIPALILSGSLYALDSERAKRLGVRAMLQKPPKMSELSHALIEAVASAAYASGKQDNLH